MATKKKFRIAMLILAIFLMSFVLIPTGSAAAEKVNIKNFSDSKVETYDIKGLDANKVKEIESRASYIKSLPETIQNAPYIGLVTADNETKKVVLGYIDNFSVSNSEKKEMKKEIKDIWNRVPNRITEKDYPEIQKIGDAVSKYVEDTYWANKQNVTNKQSIQWKTSASIPKSILYFPRKISDLWIDSKVKFYEPTSESQY
ncbi:hypothetical protein ASJ81_06500 [Methanosarcina spelaei]|uniref:Uncharacterized protein n=1 Tax=Methanosarcina spelaei TaxID=1036679 RepID=A0A2A2HSV2_9EURY|nr:hypothetical protein [Methanosarcina spelaei]PAV12360.1 hypothetical protein ASJ81_06500 [Methanosarcina spelaei]